MLTNRDNSSVPFILLILVIITFVIAEMKHMVGKKFNEVMRQQGILIRKHLNTSLYLPRYAPQLLMCDSKTGLFHSLVIHC